MLKDGRIAFEGNASELRSMADDGPVHPCVPELTADQLDSRKLITEKSMPRTRSLAWSELKIGIVAVVGDGAGRRSSSSPSAAQAGFFVAALQAEDALSRRAGTEERSRRPRRRRRDRQGRPDRVRRRRGRGRPGACKKEMQSRITTESRASIGSLSLLGEPVIDITPVDRRARRSRMATRSCRCRRRGSWRTSRRARRSRSDRSNATAQGHPRRQGHRRQAVHRRRSL